MIKFKDLIEKTNHYGWIDRIDRTGNIIDIKVNFFNYDIFTFTIFVKRKCINMYIDDNWYAVIRCIDLKIIIKELIKIVKVRNYELIETYNEIGVDLINY